MVSSIPCLTTLLAAQMAPPKAVVQAVIDEVSSSGLDPRCAGAQREFLNKTVGHVFLSKYPPKVSFLTATVKAFIGFLEGAVVFDEPEVADATVGGVVAGADDEDEEIIEDLSMAYIELQSGSVPGAVSEAGGRFEVGRDELAELFFQSFAAPILSGEGECLRRVWTTFKVAPSFTNVGLALWPSAFVLTELLRKELVARQQRGLSPAKVLELGAGVGLSMVALLDEKTLASRLIMTDYQPNITENCEWNVQCLVDSLASKPENTDLSAKISDAARVELLDWTETEENAVKIADWGCDLVVAADVIYDRCVLGPLATTIQQCLEAVPGCKVVVVQTHRNPHTMEEFFNLVAPFCNMETKKVDMTEDVGTPLAVPSPAVAAHLDKGRLSLHDTYLVEMTELIHIHTITAKS